MTACAQKDGSNRGPERNGTACDACRRRVTYVGWKVHYLFDGLTLDGSLWVDLPIGRVDICDAIEKVIDQPTLSVMRPDERVAYFRSVSAGYCDRCGDVLDGVCHCENDE